MLVTFIFIGAVYLRGVQSVCDPKIIGEITKFWDNKPPLNIISRSDGTWTVIKLTKIDTLPTDSKLKCFKEVVDAKKSVAKDYLYFQDSKDDVIIDIKLSEKTGVRSDQYTFDAKDYSASEYILYLDENVTGFWNCDEDNETAGGISVKDYEKNKDDEKTKAAIEKAVNAFKTIGLEVPQDISTDCPSVQQNPKKD